MLAPTLAPMCGAAVSIFYRNKLIVLFFFVGSNDNTRWFPYSPNNNEQPANNNNPSQEYKIETEKDLYDPNHGIVMGVINARCDDGKVV